MRAGLSKAGLLQRVPCRVWRQEWVVDCRSVGKGEPALKYLAPYVFRVALSNNRILKLEGGQVTFRYQDGATKRQSICTLAAEEFIYRFLQHVLPRACPEPAEGALSKCVTTDYWQRATASGLHKPKVCLVWRPTAAI